MPLRLSTITLVLALATSAALGDTIALRPTAVLEPGRQDVRLADVADLSGSLAEGMADLAVGRMDRPGQDLTITVQEIRLALSDAGAHWGRLNLSGRQVVVRPAPPGAASAPLAMQGASVTGTDSPRDEDAPEARSAAALVDEPTLRGELARQVALQLGVDPADLRLTFAPGSEALLERSMNDQRFEIVPQDRIEGGTVDVSVRAWENDRAVDRGIVRMDVQVRCDVAVPRQDIARGHQLAESDLQTERHWLAPRQASTAVTVAEAAGQITGAGLRAGAPIQLRQLRKPVLIRRGDAVMVRCLVGGLVVSMKAEARSPGAMDDVIELRKPGERETFNAVVTGSGEAVVNLATTTP